ncbi:MAG TPA: ABC transporter substrate-binding protein [Polyangiales bacterium]|nr:ABC transporter substrate-binding protein [Polyangiales bacterium]
MFRSLRWLGGLNALLQLLLSAAALGGCDRALGLSEYKISPSVPAADGGMLTCLEHTDCQAVAAADSGALVADHCQAGRCVALRSLDCETVTGPANDKRALLIGSLFSTSGAQRETNMARQQSAMLAVEEINAAGGVRFPAVDDLRPLAMVSCDAGRDLSRAARHLISELGVSAIVGPNTSQDTLDLATQISIESRTLLLSPTAQASSIADLIDHDLSWVMVPSDLQRAPLLLTRIRGLEAQLHVERAGRPLRLGVVLRDDVLAQGARAALSTLDWNGKPVSPGEDLRIDSYAPSGAEIAALVTEYVKFAPDVIVLVGTAETVSQFMGPLERAWKAEQRAHFVVTDSSKIPDLLELVRDDVDLRSRVTGIGVQPTPEAAPNQAAFARAYARRFGADQASTFGTGQAYDAVYALALAYTRVAHAPARGDELAFGLRGLYGGATTFALQAPNLEAAQQALLTGRTIRALGSFAPLRWDDRGALVEGSVEVFCLAAEGGEPFFKSSGLSYDVGSGETLGQFKPCQSGAPASTVETASAAPPACVDCVDAGATPPPAGPPPSASPSPPAPMMDAGAPQPLARNLACGSAAPCGLDAAEYCCISGPAGLASCETEPRPCTYEFRCSRNADCAAGEQCCETEGHARCIPAGEACRGAQFECTSARDCPTGNECCSRLNSEQTGYAATRCEPTCDAAHNSSALCEVPLDCAPGAVCRVSNYLPNLNVCDAQIR